ncbi:MAG: methyl-coenzyme M reductase subunit alpha, partial [Euryarchaeota archaeon]|nr:methyl-coenzyme M reductase subunit alpha [Euryarchaeota archaeon]
MAYKYPSEKIFVEALKAKFAGLDLAKQKVEYTRAGYIQNARKREFQAAGERVAEQRGIQQYDANLHCGGMTLGQRQLVPYKLSTTPDIAEGDDLHYVNNPAMQQMWDDMKRTIIVGMDLAHETLEKRLGKEVTPESITGYMEAVNHAMPGAALVQEHMVETHPGLVDDCYVKMFTGDDELADEIDSQYVININDLFDKEGQADELKAAIGKTTWQAVHIPTIVVRSCDGGNTSRWSAMQIGMSFIAA